MLGVWEVMAPPGEEQAKEADKGGASGDLRTVMAEMDVIEDKMDEGVVEEAEGGSAEAEEGGLGGGYAGTRSHRDPNSGCGSRRNSTI